MLKLLMLACGLVMSLANGQVVSNPDSKPVQINEWINFQSKISLQKIEQNISPPDGAPGAVIASPERTSPPYYFHWTRDSALAYLTIVHVYRASDGARKDQLKKKILDFADFSAKLQTTSNLGEPKFYLDGRAFDGAWCRPQSDGAALRAITLLAASREFRSHGDTALATARLLPVIRRDIDYVKSAWREPSCDLWEEIYGDHFYTRMVQRRALIEASADSDWLGEDQKTLASEAQAIGSELEKHWDESKGYFVATLNRTGGLDYKISNLDASVILGAIHGHTDDGFLNYTDSRLLKTAEKLLQTFHALYPINQASGTVGTAIGRYPEDKYAGTRFDGGNPWVLLTANLAQYFYRVALEYKAHGLEQNAAIAYFRAEDLLRRVKYHAPFDGSLAEQMDRNSGYMTSAPDLTWSHSEVLEMFAVKSATSL